MTTETMGERIRRARKARKLLVNELDREIGTQPGYVSRLETDKFGAVGHDKLAKIGEVLGVSLDWLIRGEGAGPEAPRDSAPPAA